MVGFGQTTEHHPTFTSTASGSSFFTWALCFVSTDRKQSINRCAGFRLCPWVRSDGKVQRRNSASSAADCACLFSSVSRLLSVTKSPWYQLPAQLALIAREFSLPSVGGVSLYLCLPSNDVQPAGPGYFSTSPSGSESAMKPRLVEEIWTMLWANYLDEESSGIAEGVKGVYGLRQSRRSLAFHVCEIILTV